MAYEGVEASEGYVIMVENGMVGDFNTKNPIMIRNYEHILYIRLLTTLHISMMLMM